MAVEKVSPGQKVLNRYLYTGGVFAGLAALTIAHYTWVSPDWPTKPCGTYDCPQVLCTYIARAPGDVKEVVSHIAASHKPLPTLLWFALSIWRPAWVGSGWPQHRVRD